MPSRPSAQYAGPSQRGWCQISCITPSRDMLYGTSAACRNCSRKAKGISLAKGAKMGSRGEKTGIVSLEVKALLMMLLFLAETGESSCTTLFVFSSRSLRVRAAQDLEPVRQGGRLFAHLRACLIERLRPSSEC